MYTSQKYLQQKINELQDITKFLLVTELKISLLLGRFFSKVEA